MSVIPQHKQAMTPMKTAYEYSHQWMMVAGRSISQKRMGLLILAFLALSVPAFGQGTVSPVARQQFFDNNGDPLAGGWLCAYEAGTTTLADTFTTSALNVANGNPLVLDAAGRATIFLSPGRSYKFVLKTATTPVNCNTGTTIWSVDNVSAVPASSAALDVTGVAGESIAAGDAVYLSTGAGGLNPAQWYKMDSDLAYASVTALQVGMAPSAIAAAATGSIRLAGSVALTGPLTPGAAYYASGTSGLITATPPTNAIRLGEAESATSLLVGYTKAPVSPRGPPCGRLTLTTAVPVTTSDVTAATTVYYTPYGGCNTIPLFDGTSWELLPFTQVSIAVPATTATMYDVWGYNNAGVLALELLAWTNVTTRATALTTQDGVYVKTGATTRLYLGSFATTAVSGQTEDSVSKRLLWNYYHRAERPMQVTDATASWTYTTAAYQQANAAATNQLAVVVGVSEDAIRVRVESSVRNSSGSVTTIVGIGLDSTTAVAAGTLFGANQTSVASVFMPVDAEWTGYPGVGYHTLVWLEYSTATGTTTWLGTNANLSKSGIFSVVKG